MLQNQRGAVLLKQRAPSGIWGGLWCFPEVADEAGLTSLAEQLGSGPLTTEQRLKPIEHTFTHFHLTIHPLQVSMAGEPAATIHDGAELRWYTGAPEQRLGLPAPVVTLLNTLAIQQTEDRTHGNG